VPVSIEADRYIWIPGNSFCCICEWWHNQPKDYGHEAQLCLLCVEQYFEDEGLRNRADSVTPECKVRANRSA
jgi:hypothetical protein